jgi:hypothetical protein
MSMHDARVRAASLSLEAATQAILGFVNAMPESKATDVLVGGWTPAGHIWHVALTNEVFIGILTGRGPITAGPGTSDFADAAWSFNAPPNCTAPDILLPPPDARRDAAARRLGESVTRFRPLIEALDPSLATQTVQLPWARVSVHQVVEWAAGHTLRHLSQVGREMHLSVSGAPVAV